MSANLALVRPPPSWTLQVQVFHGSNLERRETLSDGTYVIGSAPDADIRLMHPAVALHHAVLLVSGGNVAVKRLGQQTPEARLLAASDSFQCGPFILRTRLTMRSRSREETPRPRVPQAAPTKLPTPRLRSVPSRIDPEQTRVAQVEICPDTLVRPAPALPAPRPRAPKAAAPAEREATASIAAPAEPAAQNKLFLDLHWGAAQQAARCFAAAPQGVLGDSDERAPMPLWGFTLPEGGMQLALPDGEGFRVYLPPRAKADRPVEMEDDQPFVWIGPGEEVFIREGLMSLSARVGPVAPMPKARPFQDVPWIVVTLFILFGTGLSVLVANAPEVVDAPPEPARQIGAVKLVMPEKKPEPPKPEVEESPAAEEAPVQQAKAPKRQRAPKPPSKKAPPPVASKAMKMLSKIASAGPAMKEVLGAVDKKGLPAAPRGSSPTLAGMIGQGVPNAGIGSLGMGGGARGRGVPGGAGLLRGEGGAGIGSFGAGGLGRSGSVRGQVTRASGRSLAVQGSIDRDAVAKVVNAHLQEVRACYERALLKDPGLAGKVVLEWSISTSGAVTMARTRSSSLSNGGVERCILSSLKTWKFPSARGGQVLVSYPFLFNSVGY